MIEYKTSERHACRLLGLARSTKRYVRRGTERDRTLRERLKDLAGKRMRFGYRRLWAMLVREGVEVNHKRVYRLYREEGLAMRIRQRRRIRWNGTAVSPAAERPNERWSIDLVSDCVSRGKAIRMLTLVDDCTRECPAIEVDTSLGDGESDVCSTEWRRSEVCRKRLFRTTDRSSAVGYWLPGVRNGEYDWSSFSRESRYRMPMWKVSTGDYAMNA